MFDVVVHYGNRTMGIKCETLPRKGEEIGVHFIDYDEKVLGKVFKVSHEQIGETDRHGNTNIAHVPHIYID